MNNRFDLSDFVDVLTERKVIENLVERVKKRRKEIKMSQKELAKRSGVSYGSIRRFEISGEISLSSLLKIASTLGYLSDFNLLFQNENIKNLKDY